MPPVGAQPGAASPQLLAAISSRQTFISHLLETADCFPPGGEVLRITYSHCWGIVHSAISAEQ